MTLTYLDVLIIFGITVFAHLVWQIMVQDKRSEKAKLVAMKRMFHLGKVEGSNQIHGCQNPEWNIKEKSFEDYLELENEINK